MAKRAETTKQGASGQVSRAVLYARVSSKEQAKEGFSIPAQLKLLKDYAARERLSVVGEYVDVETAKQTGRASFGEMVAYLRGHPSVRMLLVEKTDRLYRNLKDWVTIDELDVEIHLVKEGAVLSRDSRSSEKFMHGIKVLMAKNYVDNLSEETRKGMLEKAEQGIWPSFAPLGYRNVTGPDGRKVIDPDPEVAPIVAKLFEWYATGQYSLKEVARKARAVGLVYRKSGDPVPVSTVHSILRNRLYTGQFEWNGKLYQGKHQPLVTCELWERVQDTADGRNASKHRRMKRDFPFSGLIACGHCGCSMVGEIKKQRYIYYHCTGYKGKCDEPYVREEVLGEKFVALLGRLAFDNEVLDWVRDALHESHAGERLEHAAAIERLRSEYDRLQNRIHAAYVDKLDGSIDAAFFEKISAEWRAEQDRCLRDIERHQGADQSYLEDGVRLFELAHNAQRLFAKQDARQKRRLLNFLVSNCSWRDGELTATLRQPFDLIAETTAIEAKRKAAGEVPNDVSEIWLPGARW
ncbi:MAG: recombinase family protein [Candidatus Binatia bacterium]